MNNSGILIFSNNLLELKVHQKYFAETSFAKTMREIASWQIGSSALNRIFKKF